MRILRYGEAGLFLVIIVLSILAADVQAVRVFVWHRLPHYALWLAWTIPLYIAYQYVHLRAMERKLTQREELFQLISENAADMIAVVDGHGRRLYNSPSYQKILGYTIEELQSTSVLQQIHPDDHAMILQAADEARRTGIGKRLEYRVRHKNGPWLVLESTASPICNDRGELEKMVIVNRDITERKQAEAKLAHSAMHDALTDLPNRAQFRERLQRAFERSQKDAHYKFAVLFVDIDGFKVFNDSMGHSAGDKIIVEISRRLLHCLRFEDTLFRPIGRDEPSATKDVLARFGGDEFTILVGAIADPSDAMRVAKRVQEALGTFSADERKIFISASIGIALSTTPHTRAEELLRDADIAMYRAKSLGKSRCEFFDEEMHARVVDQLDLETDLRRAVSEEEFRLHYQPIVELSTRKIVGFEALLRWQRSDQSLVMPDSFISVAEGIGLVVPLGKWVLREACRQAQLWKKEYPHGGSPSVTVNLSPKQFVHPQLFHDIEEVIAETGINPRRLHLEITESTTMADQELTQRVLGQLRTLGIGICLDDFGTGYSSLGRLRHLPVDTLKIDRSFVSQIESDAASRSIVHLIVQFAHTIQLQVVAEGVETLEEWEFLKKLGCKFGQGYLFSKAVDAETALKLLAHQGKNALPQETWPDREKAAHATNHGT
ncbi:MAG: EAL domain-containing protein [Acidobacteria bacterium]|nr:EAL domain-containing protein [Acidobacteriota bacterium]